jgi:AcrR family transcriptional regulator
MEGSVLTPWGASDTLRARRLRPGPGTPRAAVERNQRERLYGAMVAVVDEVGYEGMRVGRVAERAGVSRSALYEYFSDRQQCFLATFEALMQDGMGTVFQAYEGTEAWDVRLRRAFDILLEIAIAQPAAARLGFLEVYAAGPAAAALRAKAAEGLEGLVGAAMEQSPERAGMPAQVVAAIVGGIRIVIQTRLRRRTEYELPDIAPELWEWLLSYQTPDPPLPRLRVRQSPGPRFVATTHQHRLYVALAETIYEKGYHETIVADMVSAASMSLSTFYTAFESKEDAFVAACDFGVEQGFAAARHAYEQESEWPHKVRAGMRELLAFLAAEPEWAYMAMVEIFAAGPRARARRDRTIDLFVTLLLPGHELRPELSQVAVEAIGGAVYSLMYTQICERGAERLPEVLPTAVFLLLAPFVGNEEAAKVANETGRHSGAD